MKMVNISIEEWTRNKRRGWKVR